MSPTPSGIPAGPIDLFASDTHNPPGSEPGVGQGAELLAAIDELVKSCASRSLLPAGEIVDALLDLRLLVGARH